VIFHKSGELILIVEARVEVLAYSTGSPFFLEAERTRPSPRGQVLSQNPHTSCTELPQSFGILLPLNLWAAISRSTMPFALRAVCLSFSWL
jgi:hypothetical protein